MPIRSSSCLLPGHTRPLLLPPYSDEASRRASTLPTASSTSVRTRQLFTFQRSFFVFCSLNGSSFVSYFLPFSLVPTNDRIIDNLPPLSPAVVSSGNSIQSMTNVLCRHLCISLFYKPQLSALDFQCIFE